MFNPSKSIINGSFWKTKQKKVIFLEKDLVFPKK